MLSHQLEQAINFATSNGTAVRKAEQAGCYYCKKVFPASDVKEFLEDDTALCPKCGIDSVLPDTAPYQLNPDTLAALHRYWF